MFSNLTNEEKYHFAKTVKSPEVQARIINAESEVKEGVISCIFSIFFVLMLPIIYYVYFNKSSNYVWVLLLGPLLLLICFPIPLHKNLKKLHAVVEAISNQKVSYKEYKQLLASGELDRIVKEYEKTQVEKGEEEIQPQIENSIKEKYKFAKAINSSEVNKIIKTEKKQITSCITSIVFGALVLISDIIFGYLNGSLIVILLLDYGVLTPILLSLKVKKRNLIVKSISDGKFGFKEYKQLLASGELDRIIEAGKKIEEEEAQRRIEEETQRLAEEEAQRRIEEEKKQAESSVTLSAEEYAMFKKLVAEKEPENKTE